MGQHHGWYRQLLGLGPDLSSVSVIVLDVPRVLGPLHDVIKTHRLVHNHVGTRRKLSHLVTHDRVARDNHDPVGRFHPITNSAFNRFMAHLTCEYPDVATRPDFGR